MRRETHHYTPEQAEQHLTDALSLVDKLDPPSDLRALVFQNACQWLSAKAIVEEQFSPPMLDGRLRG